MLLKCPVVISWNVLITSHHHLILSNAGINNALSRLDSTYSNLVKPSVILKEVKAKISDIYKKERVGLI